ncbi:MAG: zinc-ribbon domain-containing protein [Geobacteraceae bacterium]|nr:zinc-ribbon domain-containing protein [Geobacteraceae bacterium]
MKLICPHCNYTRELEGNAIPSQAVQVTCPRCHSSFRFDPDTATPGRGDNAPESQAPFTAGATPENVVPDDATEADADSAPPAMQAQESIAPTPGVAAGFWIRAVAALLDSVISSALQFGMAFALGSITELSGASTLPMVQMLIMLFSTLAGVFYYVFFTGYSGQTPGKMALRLKVVRLDDTQVSYGQAFIRETIGKFISGIVLGIGYLMVALRSDKRGLHDLMADTRVIKL